MGCSMPGFPVLPCLLEFAQVHVHWFGDANQASHPLSSSSSVWSLTQHQDLFQRVSSSHQVAKALELQHQSFQWIVRTDFLSLWVKLNYPPRFRGGQWVLKRLSNLLGCTSLDSSGGSIRSKPASLECIVRWWCGYCVSVSMAPREDGPQPGSLSALVSGQLPLSWGFLTDTCVFSPLLPDCQDLGTKVRRRKRGSSGQWGLLWGPQGSTWGNPSGNVRIPSPAEK